MTVKESAGALEVCQDLSPHLPQHLQRSQAHRQGLLEPQRRRLVRQHPLLETQQNRRPVQHLADNANPNPAEFHLARGNRLPVYKIFARIL
jgi:hypothetical protein